MVEPKSNVVRMIDKRNIVFSEQYTKIIQALLSALEEWQDDEAIESMSSAYQIKVINSQMLHMYIEAINHTTNKKRTLMLVINRPHWSFKRA